MDSLWLHTSIWRKCDVTHAVVDWLIYYYLLLASLLLLTLLLLHYYNTTTTLLLDYQLVLVYHQLLTTNCELLVYTTTTTSTAVSNSCSGAKKRSPLATPKAICLPINPIRPESSFVAKFFAVNIFPDKSASTAFLVRRSLRCATVYRVLEHVGGTPVKGKSFSQSSRCEIAPLHLEWRFWVQHGSPFMTAIRRCLWQLLCSFSDSFSEIVDLRVVWRVRD